MLCEKCGATIEQSDERDMHGQMLCEDCYMDALSPARGCDPWAVYSAKSFAQDGMTTAEVNETQSRILKILEETGGTELQLLMERLEIKQSDLERELAALRHMERVRGELRDGMKIVRLW